MKITSLGSRGATLLGRSGGSTSIGQPKTLDDKLDKEIFGHAPPAKVDLADYADIVEFFDFLENKRRQLMAFAGLAESVSRLCLVLGQVACVDPLGNIYLGVDFLRFCMKCPDIAVGALAHEIGHLSHRWRQTSYKQLLDPNNPVPLDSMLQIEETQADAFAGRALAELRLTYQPLIAFIAEVQTQAHRAYLNAQERGSTIKIAYERQQSRSDLQPKIFSEWHRYTAAKGHIGTA